MFTEKNHSSSQRTVKMQFRRLIPSALFMLMPFWVVPQNRQPQGEISVVSFDQLQPLLHLENDTVYVVNFWATWCAPCIKEIPWFEQLGDKYRDSPLKILMANLDMPADLETRVIPFIEKENMKNEVILLDDPGSNRWIPLVDEDWTGAIPATLIYGKDFRYFYQKEFTFEALNELIHPLL